MKDHCDKCGKWREVKDYPLINVDGSKPIINKKLCDKCAIRTL